MSERGLDLLFGIYMMLVFSIRALITHSGLQVHTRFSRALKRKKENSCIRYTSKPKNDHDCICRAGIQLFKLNPYVTNRKERSKYVSWLKTAAVLSLWVFIFHQYGNQQQAENKKWLHQERLCVQLNTVEAAASSSISVQCDVKLIFCNEPD